MEADRSTPQSPHWRLHTAFSRMLSRYLVEGPRRDVSAGEDFPC